MKTMTITEMRGEISIFSINHNIVLGASSASIEPFGDMRATSITVL